MPHVEVRQVHERRAGREVAAGIAGHEDGHWNFVERHASLGIRIGAFNHLSIQDGETPHFPTVEPVSVDVLHIFKDELVCLALFLPDLDVPEMRDDAPAIAPFSPTIQHLFRRDMHEIRLPSFGGVRSGGLRPHRAIRCPIQRDAILVYGLDMRVIHQAKRHP